MEYGTLKQRIMHKIHRYILLAAVSVLPLSCETLSVDEEIQHAPIITSFTPMTAPAGAEVVITGEYLNNVTSARIGDVEVEIIEKVSNTRLSIEVKQGVTSGRIILVNPTGEGASDTEFTCSYAVPEITASLLQQSAELGEEILISGTHLDSAVGVFFSSEEDEGERHEAEIISRNDDEMVAKVPYVKGSQARITMSYYDESGLQYTSSDGAPSIEVIKYSPALDLGFTFERTAVGSSITLTGQYLNNIERVTVRRADPQEGESAEEFDAIFSASGESLSFTVPAGDFPDGETATIVKAYWFDGNESAEFTNTLTVYVPLVFFWQNIVTECQTQNENGLYAAFFSPQTGLVYPNADWATVLDPIAMKNQGAQYADKNVLVESVISEEEYYSVVPYFFFSVSSGTDLQINSPANSNSQLKNFGISYPVSSGNRVPGTNSSTASGTPILAFRALNAENSAEAELIRKVVNGEIEDINEELFPIDAANQTIAGVGFGSASGGIKHTGTPNWPGVSTPADKVDTVQDLGDSDLVILMAWYDYNGYNSDNDVENIRRIGLMHITQVHWIVSNNDFRGTQVTFDCYWQKYDYDYSKLQ